VETDAFLASIDGVVLRKAAQFPHEHKVTLIAPIARGFQFMTAQRRSYPYLLYNRSAVFRLHQLPPETIPM